MVAHPVLTKQAPILFSLSFSGCQLPKVKILVYVVFQPSKPLNTDRNMGACRCGCKCTKEAEAKTEEE
jgi:hypothetical protein